MIIVDITRRETKSVDKNTCIPVISFKVGLEASLNLYSRFDKMNRRLEKSN